jgi:hypothetical protein
VVCKMIGTPALAIGDCLVGVVRISSLKNVPHLLKISVCNTFWARRAKPFALRDPVALNDEHILTALEEY